MKRIAVALLLLGLVACGHDKPTLAPVNTSSTAALGTIPPDVTTTTEGVILGAPTTSTPTSAKGDPYNAMVPPDGITPAAGACSNATGGVAAITLNPDVPAPRCIIVHDTDRLKITNNMGVTVQADDGGNGFVITINNGATDEEVKAVGCCWQPGVHRLRISNANTQAKLYGGSGPEVWLQA